MKVRSQLKILSIISSFIFIIVTIYLKYFFTILNSNISNLFIFCSVLIFISLLVYGSFILENSSDVYFFIPQSLLFTFLARAIPNLRLSYPSFHDPYFHFVCTFNITMYSTLSPILDWWYGGVNTQLHWPDMHIITAILVDITKIDAMQFFRFQEPALGMIFFAAVFLLTKTVTNNNGVSLLAGLFASINDIIIFYQSEYHPQGLALIYFVLILYTFIKSRQVIDVRYRYMSFIFIVAFVLSHYFTPLFLSLIFSSYILVTLMITTFSNFKNSIWIKYGNMFQDIASDHVYFIVVIIVSLSYHFFIYIGPCKEFLTLLAFEPPLHGQLVSVGHTNVPLLSSILSSCKWGMFLLAVISLLLIFKTKNTNEFRLGIILVCIVFAGIIGNYALRSPLERLIAFYVPLAAVFTSLTLFRFKNQCFDNINKNRRVIIGVSIASIIITAGFFNSQMPAYFFKDSSVDTYYFFSNKLTPMDEYKVAGEWIGKYSIKNSSYGTEFDTRIIPFFYGKRSDNSIVFQPTAYSFNYMMANPTIPYNYNRTRFASDLHIIYSNKELNIYWPNS